jgi:hypothetical protein
MTVQHLPKSKLLHELRKHLRKNLEPDMSTLV